MLDFGDVTFDVDVTVNASFESLLSISSTFNPAAMAASVVLQTLQSLIFGGKERKLIAEQDKILSEIRDKLNELERAAAEIINLINKLPEEILHIVDDSNLRARLDGYYVALESQEAQFRTLPGHTLSLQEWELVKDNFVGICRDEYRPARLLQLIAFTELVEFVSAGRENAFFSDQLKSTLPRLADLQKSLALDIVKETNVQTSVFTDAFSRFTSRPLVDNNITGGWAVYGKGQLASLDVSRPDAQIIVGATTKLLDDVRATIALPITTEYCESLWAGGTYRLNDGASVLVSQIIVQWNTVLAVLNQPEGPGDPPHDIYYREMTELREIIKAEPLFVSYFTKLWADVIAAVDRFKQVDAPFLTSMSLRFVELQQIKLKLQSLSETDYSALLAGADYHVAAA